MPTALVAALDLLNAPGRVRVVRRLALPPDTTLLLRIVAGEAVARDEAVRASGRAPERIAEAATFFVEQILLAPGADPYRILGAPRNAPDDLLRAHRALLLRWAHPDVAPDGAGAASRRSAAARIIEAWAAVRTPEGRADIERSPRARPPARRGFRAGYGRRPPPRTGWLGVLLSLFDPSTRSN